MTTKKSTTKKRKQATKHAAKKAASKPAFHLSADNNVHRLFQLATDESATEEARREIQAHVDRLVEGAGVAELPSPHHPGIYQAIVKASALSIENAGRREKGEAASVELARKSYARLAGIIEQAQATPAPPHRAADPIRELVARAKRIVREYGSDIDTRVEIQAALADYKAQQGEDRLRFVMGLHDAGETFAEWAGMDEQYIEAARQIIHVAETSPDNIRKAIADTLDEAERRAGLRFWQFTDAEDEAASGGYSLIAIARAIESGALDAAEQGDDNSHRFTHEEAEEWAEGEGLRLAMEDDDDNERTVMFISLLDYLADEADSNQRGAIRAAAFRGAVPIFMETENAVNRMRAAALSGWRARAGK